MVDTCHAAGVNVIPGAFLFISPQSLRGLTGLPRLLDVAFNHTAGIDNDIGIEFLEMSP